MRVLTLISVFFAPHQPKFCVLDLVNLTPSVVTLPSDFGLEGVDPLSKGSFLIRNHFNERFLLERYLLSTPPSF